MANTLTLNRIKLIFEDLANHHLMINDYGFGPSYNIGADKPLKYPFLWIEPINTRVVSGKGNSQAIEYYTFYMYVMDKINKGDDNFLDTSSDCDYISKTIFAELDQQTAFIDLDMVIDGDWTSEPVYEQTEDNSNGWQSTFTIKLPLRYSPCNDPICKETLNPTYSIGATFSGGLIFYILQPSDIGYDINSTTYLIAKSDTENVQHGWGLLDYIGSTTQSIGMGLTNSILIDNFNNHLDYAAHYSLTLNENNYTDWYLPSYNEMALLFNNISTGWVTGAGYWSSSELDANNAYAFDFGGVYSEYKDEQLYSRPIRTEVVSKYNKCN